MPFLTNSELQKRLNSPDNLINKLTIHDKNVGVGDRGEEIPIEIKKTLAILANEGAGQTTLQDIFKIAQPTISHYANGKTGFNRPNEEIQKVVKKTEDRNKDLREEVENQAISSVLKALQIVPDKINSSRSLKSLTGAAKDLSFIADKMSDRNKGDLGSGQQVHLHIYRPQMKAVEDYEVIDVSTE